MWLAVPPSSLFVFCSAHSLRSCTRRRSVLRTACPTGLTAAWSFTAARVRQSFRCACWPRIVVTRPLRKSFPGCGASTASGRPRRSISARGTASITMALRRTGPSNWCQPPAAPAARPGQFGGVSCLPHLPSPTSKSATPGGTSPPARTRHARSGVGRPAVSSRRHCKGRNHLAFHAASTRSARRDTRGDPSQALLILGKSAYERHGASARSLNRRLTYRSLPAPQRIRVGGAAYRLRPADRRGSVTGTGGGMTDSCR